ncbi:sugar phosphate isomerase/epimerase family protein [Glaciimonas sp. PCH181]|uniref:sugar phosphate isomerase/epimerase family protein n=1 Tax=Glaciimonas sp. PCH181 TaxID=2133943 RepID=UPI000D33E291|nr:sugar phosphate isomerase/epimerase family protein [Glaciimonas sp. PCH181]PUA18445.1 sugar phosphate isomerase/epimerase [Glaciimonas sp. PCH181]
MLKKNMLTMHSTVTKHANLVMDIDVAKTAGFDAMEITTDKLKGYLAAGYSEQDLRDLLKDITVPGIGFLVDIERQGEESTALYDQAEEMFRLANIAGAKGIEVITGPLEVQAVIDHRQGKAPTLYSGLLGHSESEQMRLTAKNLAALADKAQEHGLLLYLEALAWTPIGSIAKALQLIDRAERSNVKVVIDYWHGYAAGDKPEEISKINKELIYGVHICDSLLFESGVPNEAVLRNVATGQGVLNLQEWTDAVKATGYDGWWGCELFSKKQQQQNSYSVAHALKALMEKLVGK